MKRFGILLYALGTATAGMLGLAACGGGGGGGGGGNVPFTNAVALQNSELAPAPERVSTAVSINDGTQIPAGAPAGTTVRVEAVGSADDAANPGVLQPMVWDFAPGAAAVTTANGQPVNDPAGVGDQLRAEDLPNLGTGTFGVASAINNRGEIVGQAEGGAAGTPVEPVFWAAPPTPGGTRAVPTSLNPGVAGAAFGMTNSTATTPARIVGEVDRGDGVNTQAAFWSLSAAGVPSAPTLLLEPAGATSSSAFAISEANVIVGEVTDATGTHAAVWKPTAGAAGAPPTFPTAPVLLAGVNPAAVPAPPIPTLTGDSTAIAVVGNTVLGELTDTATGEVHAVQWPGILGAADAGGPTRPIDLGRNTTAGGMSPGGRMVGSLNGNAALLGGAAVRLHLDRTTGTPPTTVVSPTVNGSTNAINSSNRAVGTANGKAFFATP